MNIVFLSDVLLRFCHYKPTLRAQYLRNRDRQLNVSRYPYLHYPELYIVKGGYSAFFEKFKVRSF